MTHDPGSSRLCGRCGSDVGGLLQCPRCRAPLPSPGTTEPAPYRSGSFRPRRRAPLWRRMPVLTGLTAAGLVGAVTWWAVAGRAPAPAESASEAAGTPGSGTSAPRHLSGEPSPTSPYEPAPSSTTATPPTQPAEQQAWAVNDLLSSSSSARSSLSDAIEHARRCERRGLDTIQDITDRRREQLTDARALGMTALAGGAELKDALVDALRASYEADAAFLAWARRQAGGNCRGSTAGDRDFRRGIDRSGTAQKAKVRFSKMWRPIAIKYDLTTWKPDQI
ncbi:hypothetical protein FE391_29190 [Nonomuraea sp. KC401]|uniref:hypothetical protein n=1 Tax=unclassified Nonomuraea TaxID=2593643 RepID=UPI0010FE9584|nr:MULTISPECIES: hypothetical protein [unclassified Nonomuraea]NBE97818.1 hypothetical protein [Nonomuraea sp. K271]TLF63064.1 hypothetical protein FE391_29190 [Nonomuraea sp. KC401]